LFNETPLNIFLTVFVLHQLFRTNVQHQLYFAYLRHLWATGNRDEALGRLERLSAAVDLVSQCEKISNSSLQVSCWLKLGDWKVECSSPSGVPSIVELQTEVLLAYKKATASKSNDYKAWHAWALMNFRLAQQSQERSGATRENGAAPTANEFIRQTTSISPRTKNQVVAAVVGFKKAITFGTKRWSASVQQDMLNFLTCLFKFGEVPEVSRAINDGLMSVTLESWLGVLPQLLARIHIQSPSIRSSLHGLLTRLGTKHPQALMYPLSVLLKSPVVERKQAAENLMNSLKAHSNDLVEQSLMVSSELIRVAILWLEMWHEGLEDASRLYYGEGNVQGMLDVLLPLHEQLEKGPSTRREHDFIRSFGRDLGEAHALLKEYIRLARSNRGTIPTQGGFNDGSAPDGPNASRNAEAEFALREVWDLYYTVFRRINKQLPGLVRLELANCSPALLQAHHLELGVPGSYRVDGSYVRIERFRPSVQVITSKQRPRKVTLQGNNGKEYMFLLKGHEDLRQDERVMQLFGLVNALLAKDPRTNKHDLNIQRYAITPLSHDAGLVGWVPHCETLHSLIRDYRESKKILLNTENREMLKMAPDYDLLTVMQKVEVFDTALQRTLGKGNDLYEVLWIKSSDSEEWLEHRTKYTRSLAVMSMVGYILGLGDRHPSNLMLDEISGRVLHIDFGKFEKRFIFLPRICLVNSPV
jgi:FKBP12-rapamycin complex-associated protein